MTIYLDHAASTPIAPAVADRISELLQEEYANPSSLHAPARSARKAIEEAREVLAAALGGRPEEIVFTSGGTEADNLAVQGVARRRHREGRDRIVVSAGEHHAVLDAARALGTEGFEVQLAPLDAAGRVDLEVLEQLVDARTAIVAVMAANNETGVIQPVEAVAEITRTQGAILHCDAVQALPWIDCSFLSASTIAVSAHKIGGPKGVGALLVRRKTPIQPLVHGGGQERALRPGTLNTVGIAAFGTAVQVIRSRLDDQGLGFRQPDDAGTIGFALAGPGGLAMASLGVRPHPIAVRRDRLQERILAELEGVHVTGGDAARLPGHLHLTFDGIDAESLLLVLDAQGLAASSGSACASGAAEPSHVLLAMGMPKARAMSALRLSLGWTTTDADVEEAADIVVGAVRRLRGR